MKAYVDKDTCIGCELCTQICPDVFSMDDDGKSVAINAVSYTHLTLPTKA